MWGGDRYSDPRQFVSLGTFGSLEIGSGNRTGIPCKMDSGNAAHMHHKFALFDGRRLMTGSFNWTRSASEQNEENLIVTADPVLVKAFSERFELLWSKLRDVL